MDHVSLRLLLQHSPRLQRAALRKARWLKVVKEKASQKKHDEDRLFNKLRLSSLIILV